MLSARPPAHARAFRAGTRLEHAADPIARRTRLGGAIAVAFAGAIAVRYAMR